MEVTIEFYFLLVTFSSFIINGYALKDNELEFSTKECQLTEPVYNYTFDFKSLQSDLAHVVRSVQGDIFEFNVCGSISKKCAGKPNMAACLTKNGKQYILGENHELKYKNGKMYFKFINGGLCKDGKNYSLNVLVSCDYTMDDRPLPVTSYRDEECSFYVLWETPYACLPEPDNTKYNTCSIEDKKTGHVFDLMPLSDSNHRIADRNGSFFIVNVCKPVLYTQSAMCPQGSSICYINKTAKGLKDKFLNCGFAENKPMIENGKIKMSHLSGIVCNSTHNFTSTIYFECDFGAKFGKPEYIGVKGCNYEFFWQTSHVCINIIPCYAIDLRSGFEYDFGSLSKKIYQVKHYHQTYSFGICSSAEPTCLNNAGICENEGKQTTTLGKVNNRLRFNETGTPYLLYENGAPCSLPNRQWSTRIEFTCLLNDFENQPKIIENSNCLLLIHFPTKLACQKQISCKTQGAADGDKIDLTPLISTAENYIARVNESLEISNKNSVRYFLNVCRPLVSQYGLGCSGGSAACEAIMGPVTPEQEKSLGFPDVSLTLIDVTRAELKYLRGDICPADTSTKLSSSIHFYCDPKAGKGTPILQSIIDQCHYRFDWATNVICPSHLCEFNVNNCEIINEQMNVRFNLRNASFADKGKIMVKANPQSFYIDLCGPNRKAITDYSRGIVKLFFNTNGPCGLDGFINVVLQLSCNDTEHHSSSSDDEQCSLIINQNTPEICPLLGLPAPKHDTSTTTTKPSTTKPPQGTMPPSENNTKQKKEVTTIAVLIGAVLVGIILSVTCFVILRNPQRRVRFKNFFRKVNPVVQYSRVANTEEANLLLEHNGEYSDSSDDEMLL